MSSLDMTDSLRDKKKESLVMLDRWSSYTGRIVWEFAWVDSALIILDKWSFYRDGHLNRFGCSLKNRFLPSLLMTTFFSWDSFSNIYT